ncbi:MAG: phosphate acyltransferase PlsX [Acidiferrobacterales bacterium]
MTYTVALDAMGGDHGASVTVPAALSVLAKQTDLRLILVGKEDRLRAELERLGAADTRNLSLHHASEVVDMDEPPAQALKKKKDSSMRVAIDLVKAGQANAAVSAGNTGALMATARFVLKMLPGINRPAILKILPTIKSETAMLDLGANVDCSAEQLRQFGIMGAALMIAAQGVSNPKVGLLNIGEEDIKGNEVVKQANELMQQAPINYVGYVEGDEIYSGNIDVIVCDGFVGNVALKTTEGLAKMISVFIREEFSKNYFTRFTALVALPVLRAFRRRVDPRRYNGASLVGLRGTVVKSHGGADALAFEYAIEEAIKEARNNVPEKISSLLAEAVAENG